MLASTEFTGGQRRRVYILTHRQRDRDRNIVRFSYLTEKGAKNKKKKHLSD